MDSQIPSAEEDLPLTANFFENILDKPFLLCYNPTQSSDEDG